MARCPNCGQETKGDFCEWCRYPLRGRPEKVDKIDIKPTWGLAWGLWWRIFLITLGIYAIIFGILFAVFGAALFTLQETMLPW